jgi:hypothetical protein
MSIKVVLAKAHRAQLEDVEIKRELCSIQDELNRVELSFKEDTVNFVFVKGMYLHDERKMLTVCLFVNKMDKPITELHGVLRLKFQDRTALIAKTTVDFDEPFIGMLNPSEALLVHIGIPVKGLTADENFTISNITGSFDNVRVTMN